MSKLKHRNTSAKGHQAPSRHKTIVDFKRPPVNEVIFGIGFKEFSGFSTPQMGLYWDTVRSAFPIAEVRGSIGPPADEGAPVVTVVTGGAPPIRFFLRSADGTELIQIQSNRLLYNWIRTEAGNEYPRYRKVVERFQGVRRDFTKFMNDIGLEDPKIRELRLEYLNHIPQGDGWREPKDVSKILPLCKFRRRGMQYLRDPSSFNMTSRHPVAHSDSHLDLSIRTAQKGAQRIITLQLSVVGSVEAPSDKELQEWFDMAREAIDLSFSDLASRYAKEHVWGISEHTRNDS